MTTPETTGSPTGERSGASSQHPDPRRWVALGVVAAAQLMVVLDGSIVNIALPSAQAELGISDVDRQWVVTAYVLAFGGLLLLGGRIADHVGRKRVFIVGLVGGHGGALTASTPPPPAAYLASRTPSPEGAGPGERLADLAAVAGYHRAFTAGALLMVAAFAAVVVLVTVDRTSFAAPAPEAPRAVDAAPLAGTG